MRNLFIVLKDIWNGFVRGGLGENSDHSYARRVKFANAFSFLGILTLLGFGTARILSRQYLIGWVDIGGGFFIILNLFLLRVKKDVLQASLLGTSGLLAVILFLFLTGGVNKTGIYWIYFFPVISFFLFGKKGGFVWLGILYTAVLAIQLLNYFGIIQAAYDFGTTVQMLASLFLESSLVYYYAKVMDDEERIIENHNHKLHETNQEIKNEMAQRQKAEKELLRISQAVRSSSDAISIEDTDGTHLYHNKAFFNLLNYSISGLNTQGGFVSIIRENEVGKRISEVVKKGGSWAGEIEVVKKDGSLLEIFLRVDAIRDHGGKLIGSVFIYTDVSERHKWEKALITSEERFRRVVASISDHIYMTHYSKNKEPVNEYISPNVEKLTGYPHAKFLEDWNFWAKNLIHKDDQAVAIKQVENFNNGKDSQVEYRITKADGGIIWVRDSGRVEHGGEKGGFTIYGIISDISLNKKQEQEKESLMMELRKANEELEVRVTERTAELADANLELKRSYNDTIMAITAAMDAKDSYTRGHSERVRDIAMSIGDKLGLPGESMKKLSYAALLHDIGKIGISDLLLTKKGKLTDNEYEEVKMHPVIGGKLVDSIGLLKDVAPIITAHHEHYDGSGYPRGLRGKEIPIEARIIAVADAYESMISDRPYRKGYEMKEVIRRLDEASGTQLDPEIVNKLKETI